MTTHPPQDELAGIRERDYVRARVTPPANHQLYLHLVDLWTALKQNSVRPGDRVLDYGCGGSPYREHFAGREYVRADYVMAEGLNHRIDESGRVDEPDGSFDFVLSTQVLEHVQDVPQALRECHRLLKPGGRLLLTTHGLFHEHGCPYDFRRWTTGGLAHEFKSVGFEIVKAQKMTIGPRALVLFMSMHFPTLRPEQGDMAKLFFGAFRRFYYALMPSLHRLCDRIFPSYMVQNDDAIAPAKSDYSFYANVLVLGRKP